jgi:predicted nucleic acid-binding protein
MRRWLVDTGPFVAYLDGADPAHGDVATCLTNFAGQLVTTGAVVTEVMYFVSEAPEGPLAFAEMLARGRVHVVESMQPGRILAAARLMERYADTPMDFADATLVGAADQLGVLDILTLDRRGFSTYRTGAGKRFRLVLDD